MQNLKPLPTIRRLQLTRTSSTPILRATAYPCSNVTSCQPVPQNSKHTESLASGSNGIYTQMSRRTYVTCEGGQRTRPGNDCRVIYRGNKSLLLAQSSANGCTVNHRGYRSFLLPQSSPMLFISSMHSSATKSLGKDGGADFVDGKIRPVKSTASSDRGRDYNLWNGSFNSFSTKAPSAHLSGGRFGAKGVKDQPSAMAKSISQVHTTPKGNQQVRFTSQNSQQFQYQQLRSRSTESLVTSPETAVGKPGKSSHDAESLISSVRPSFSVTFDDCRLAFSGKSTWEIVRALAVLWMCSMRIVSDNSETLMSLCRRMLGGRLTDWLLKRTVYGQFVGGETQEEIVSAVEKLKAVGVGPLLAVPMEDDVDSHHQDADHHFDSNLETVLDSMSLACDLDPVFPMIQLKITALLPGDVCALVSQLCPKPSSCPDIVEAVARTLSGQPLNVSQMFGRADFPEAMADQLGKGLRRVAKVCEFALARQVIVMVDAEYTYLNPALNLVALAMMHHCNDLSRPPLVFYTYQNYLKSTRETLERDVAYLSSKGVGFGTKMVRGAYMHKERKMAAKEGTEDPVQDGMEATSAAYNDGVAWLLDKMAAAIPNKYRLIVATHNEESALLAVKRMEELGINPNGGSVFFGQVMGMADHISCSLGVSGFLARKSIPYGSVADTIPYLARRAHENGAVMAGTRNEHSLLSAELWRRLQLKLGKQVLEYRVEKGAVK